MLTGSPKQSKTRQMVRELGVYESSGISMRRVLGLGSSDGLDSSARAVSVSLDN